jgi:inner membrane protein
MPTPITHAIASVALAKIIMKENSGYKILFWSVVCATLADIDFIGYFLGVPINNFFGHRGFTHSIFFAFIISWLVCLVFFREFKFNKNKLFLFINFFLIGLTHPILDFITSKHYGVALLSPFSNHRFIFPWAPINDSIGDVGVWNYYKILFWQVLGVEVCIILLSLVCLWFISRRKAKIKSDLIKRQ